MTKILSRVLRIVTGIIIMAIFATITIGTDNKNNSSTPAIIDLDGGNIASGQTVNGTIDPVGDTDTFKFYGRAGQVVVIEAASGDRLRLGPQISLYNSSGLLEKKVVTGLNYNRIENYMLKQTGVYTIIVSNSYLNTGKYNLSLVVIPKSSSSMQDPDGGDILSGQTYQGNINPLGDTDIFVFYGRQGEGVIIDMTTTNGSLAPRIDLYNSSGLEKSTQNYNRATIENYLLKQTGIYTIITSNSFWWTSIGKGKYSLSFVKIPSALHGIYNPFPADKAIVTNLDQSFKWNIEGNVVATYDVYFGEDIITPLNKIGNNISLREMRFPAMQYNKVYYWHIEAHTPNGIVQGPYWWFYTKNPVSCTASTIYGYKFNDTNSNKTKDIGEAGIPNWVINLKGVDTCTRTLVSRITATNTTGYYSFGGINAGTYIVYEDFILDWLPTTDAAYTVRIPSISTNIRRDFGNKK